MVPLKHDFQYLLLSDPRVSSWLYFDGQLPTGYDLLIAHPGIDFKQSTTWFPTRFLVYNVGYPHSSDRYPW